MRLLIASMACCLSTQTLWARPIRVVSQTLASDEIILELKKDSLQEIVGVSSLAINPEYSNVVTQVKQLKIPIVGNELEQLVMLKPDLVILASYNRVELINLLKSAKIKTMLLKDFGTVEDILNNIASIGAALGEKKRAAEMQSQLRRRLEELTSPKVQPKVLNFNADHAVAGKGTLFDAVIDKAPAYNMARDLGIRNFQQISLEKLATLKPAWIIAASLPNEKDATVIARIQATPGWKEIPAVKRGRIILIPSRLLFTASQYIVDLVELLNKKLYAK